MATPKELSKYTHWHVFSNECSVPRIQFLKLNVSQLEVVHTFQFGSFSKAQTSGKIHIVVA